MEFEADLDVVVDGAAAHVRGDGATLVVESPDPVALLRAIHRGAGRRSRQQLAVVADGLAARGLTACVHGPQGRIVTVGAGADTPALRMFAGTRHVQANWVNSLTSLMTPALERHSSRWIWAGGLATAATTLAGWAWWSHRAPPGR